MEKYQFPGKYFDEFEKGQTFITPARTVTEADIVLFTGLSGDFYPLHTDEEFSKKTLFGGRVAHGLLGLAIVSGLYVRLGITYGTAKAFSDLYWKFTGPIKAGDTIYARIVVSEKRESKSKPDQGTVTFDISVCNQRDEIVQKGQWNLIMARK